jgi:hypothetical protein
VGQLLFAAEGAMTEEGHPFDLIEVERRYFVETHNPMHVWTAYSLARCNAAPIPDWVLHYFDHSARELLKLSFETRETGGENMGPKLARSLGFTSGGPGSGLSNYQNMEWIVYGMHVRARIAQGSKEYIAIEDVSKQLAVHKSTVTRAYKLFDKLFPGDGIFPEDTV